ncbi:hypothetical protein [Streptomyces sp. NPDC006739]|uniref:hypothetical protein n=1 Tax=Streptomyces sp. NPDC006739 TaxID=3364763 RepID=UPI0036CDD799
MTTAPYEIETSKADDGTIVPAEGIWTLEGEGATDNGFAVYCGLHVAGIGAPNDDGLYPDRSSSSDTTGGPTSSRPPPRTWTASTAGEPRKTG